MMNGKSKDGSVKPEIFTIAFLLDPPIISMYEKYKMKMFVEADLYFKTFILFVGVVYTTTTIAPESE